MPLKRGKSDKVVSSNISELMHAWMNKGSIGKSGPMDKVKAQKMAIAISMGRSRKGKK
jgi:hypothetical protein